MITCENNKELHNRILSRKPAFEPTEVQRAQLRTFFENNPDSLAAYLFFDEHVEDAVSFRLRMTSRTAQLVSIATDGFPVLVSRNRILGFDSCPLCKAASN